MGFSRQEYWSGLPILLQRIFQTAACNAAIFPIQPGSPALQAGSYLSYLGSPYPGRAESKSVCLGQITSFLWVAASSVEKWSYFVWTPSPLWTLKISEPMTCNEHDWSQTKSTRRENRQGFPLVSLPLSFLFTSWHYSPCFAIFGLHR